MSPNTHTWHIIILYGGIMDKIAIYCKYTMWCFDIGIHCKRIPISKLYNTFIHHLMVTPFSCVWEPFSSTLLANFIYTIEYYQLYIRPSDLIHLRLKVCMLLPASPRVPTRRPGNDHSAPCFCELSVSVSSFWWGVKEENGLIFTSSHLFDVSAFNF